MQQTTAPHESKLETVLNGEQVMRIQNLVKQVPAADHIVRYALRMTRATRIKEPTPKPKVVEQYVAWRALRRLPAADGEEPVRTRRRSAAS